jgi:pimeloyl-ACP methyl ester carboxylesterase
MQFMWSTLQLTGLTFPVRSATPWKSIQREVFYWQPKGEETAAWIARVKNEDAVDYWYRNAAGFAHNINAELKRIKARTLVVHVQNDQWLMVENARKAAAAVPGGLFATLADPGAHYGVFKAPNVLKDTISAFIEDRFTASLPGMGGGGSDGGAAPGKPAGLAK